MIKLDIKDFFPSITPTIVRTTLLKLGFSRPVSRMLCLLTTYREQLPQGPPTSPGIANLVLLPLARRFERLCLDHGVQLTIYGDDITVSSGSRRVLKLKNLFMRIIAEEGFDIHPQKIQVLKPRDKKKVTGVVVNKCPNIDKEYYRLLRAQIHNCRVKGSATQFPGDQRKARDSLFGNIAVQDN
jgi:RNA-directed DNA polymerase